jgi:predicted CoA-substrate-specific enzyme activase
MPGGPDRLRFDAVWNHRLRREPVAVSSAKLRLGVDVGSVSVNMVVLDAAAEVVEERYVRHKGHPMRAAAEVLSEAVARHGADSILGLATTGAGGRVVAEVLGGSFVNEVVAQATATGALHPEVRTIVEIGGEDSKLVFLRRPEAGGPIEVADFAMNTLCAAGTGSFLDQQASRLGVSIGEFGRLALQSVSPPRVAGRCSVFAKSDMIHLQQKATPTHDIIAGLCCALVRNFKSTVGSAATFECPVSFQGGVAANAGIVRAVRDVLELGEGELIIPEHFAAMGAIGAVLKAGEELGAADFDRLEELREYGSRGGEAKLLAPLRLERSVIQQATVTPPRPAPGQRPAAYLGVDVGSISTNLVVIDQERNVLAKRYLMTAGRPIEAVRQGLLEIGEEVGDLVDIRGVCTTGSGRYLTADFIGADVVKNEITAQARGALQIDPTVDTIFEIGGQDSKFISLESGHVVDFEMNKVCAAGTGSFLEEQAEKLGIAIKEEFARLALASTSPTRLGERCTVFMERDVIGLLLKGAEVGDLCAGLAYSVALNYLNRVVRGRRIGKVIFFQGGTAYNDAVAAAFSQILGKPIIVPPHNGVMGAIGMALIARERMQGTNRPSRFRGYDLYRVNFSTREFVCRACSNYCDMKEFTIEGQRSYWGDKCSDKFRKRARTDRQPVIEDLLEFRDKALEEGYVPPQGGGRPTVGIPRSMYFYDHFPFWCAYFQELGFDVVVSSPTDRRITALGEELTIAEPCFPVKLAHGHVQELRERGVDYILIPNAVNAEAPASRVDSHMCPWNQTLPFVVRAVPQLEDVRGKFLAPTVHFRYGRKHVEKELGEFARTLKISRRASDRAVLAAYAAQGAFTDTLLEAGAQALEKLRATGEPALVLLGRTYNIYDRSGNCDIPRKLRTIYGANVLPMDFLPLDLEDISDVNPNMYWNSGRRILAAARIAQRHRNLHLIYISNFKCGPDSYIKSFLDDAAGRPSLVLQFDGHSNDAGFITRCEAYLDSKGFLRCQPSAIAT